PEPQEAAPAWSPEPAPSLLDRWIDAGSALIEQGAENLRRMRQLPAAEPSRLARVVEALAQPVIQAPWNRSLVGPKRQLAYFTVGLEDIKRIRSAHGGTVNDVAVSTVMEGVANYLAARKEPLDEQFLRLMCPVNVRSEDDDALSMSGNRVSALFPRFEAQPLGIPERLRRVRTQLQTLKAEGQAEAVEQLQHSAPELPPVAALATQVIGTRFDPTAVAAAWPAPVPRTPPPRALPHLGFNFTVTNVPGPFWTQYVAGHRVINQYGTLMLGGTLGMGVTANSYAGQLTIGFTADPRLVPDVEALRDSAEQAFQALLDASTPQAADQAEAEAAVDIEERAA
ncbi:MAG: WS/DGAT domain-containing protein, partial [Pseudomonadota bacterium]